jgi:hypothetical protein
MASQHRFASRIAVVGLFFFACWSGEAQAQAPKAAPPASIAPESVKKVKKATAYLKVVAGDGETAEGSGFFAMEPGIVLTNAHVVGMLGKTSKPPRSIDVVIGSGEADEVAVKARVVGVDRANDLAVLKVDGDKKRWPAPLTVELDMSNLSELQKVYIFGFPLGSGLGKEITASESSISSFRKDRDGALFQIQLNGGLHPGNSGGPIVDSRGVVVGVAVSGIRGTQLHFAVPGDKIRGIVEGRVQDVLLGQPYRDKEQVKLPVKIACLDPLDRIRTVEVQMWTGPMGRPRPAALKAPTPLPGDGEAKTVAAKYQASAASLDVALPAAPPPKGQVYWLRPVVTNQAGVKHWGAASVYQPSDAPPVDRLPASLTAQLASGERSLKLSSKSTLLMTQGRDKLMETERMNLEVLETLDKNPKGAGILLVWGKGLFLSEIDGRKIPMNRAVYAAINRHVHGFQCDPSGALVSFGFVKFNLKKPADTEEANDMAQTFLTSYQFVSLPLPGRQVNPGETWEAKIRLILGREKKKDVIDVVLTCTYEGVRKVEGKTEALINLVGEINVLKSERPLMRKPSDRVTGTAVFDVGGGYVSKLNIALTDERDLGGLTFLRSFEADLIRVPGNAFGIAKPVIKSGPVVAKGKTILEEKGDLAGPAVGSKQVPQKAFTVELSAGKTYVIDLKQAAGSKIDPYLRLTDAAGKLLAQDDDSGGGLNAQIVFRAPNTASYRVQASSIRPNVTGGFVLTVKESE